MWFRTLKKISSASSAVKALTTEEDKNKVKNKGNLLLKQSHSTAEGAEIAEETEDGLRAKTTYCHKGI